MASRAAAVAGFAMGSTVGDMKSGVALAMTGSKLLQEQKML